MSGRTPRLLDDFLFGVADSGLSAASATGAHRYHRAFRELPFPRPLQHYLICIADSVSTKT